MPAAYRIRGPYPGILAALLGFGLGYAGAVDTQDYARDAIAALLIGVPIGYLSGHWITEGVSFVAAAAIGYGLSLDRAVALDPSSHNLAGIEILLFLMMTALIFTFSGWLGSLLQPRERPPFERLSPSESLSLWIVPVSLLTVTFGLVIASAMKYERQIRAANVEQFKSTALKIRAAEISYLREHGAFPEIGPMLAVEGVTWRSPDRVSSEWSTIAGGYVIELQRLSTCTAGTCLLIGHPPGGGRICVTADGQVKPDLDVTLSEHITTGDAAASLRDCVPPDAR
jgi:hypothetical protein